MVETSGFYLPYRIARAFFVAMEDVMGQHGLSTLLNIARMPEYLGNFPPDTLEREFDFAALAAISESLEVMYGARGGRGMALRVGRASFAQGIKRFGIMKGFVDPAFRALPIETRVEYGLKALASIYTNFTDQNATSDSDDSAFIFTIENSPMAWGRVADKPVCHAQVGIIQECLRWASNGYEFYVRETTCRATGADECVFRINKTPIGDGNQAIRP